MTQIRRRFRSSRSRTPRRILRTVSATDPVIVAGNGSGLVSLASSGGLQVDRPNFYSASFAGKQAELAKLLKASGTSLVVTDTNRRQGRRWGSVRESEGYTERAGERPLLVDPTDNRLDVFPGSNRNHPGRSQNRSEVQQLRPQDMAMGSPSPPAIEQ